jgi:hypothetical protein
MTQTDAGLELSGSIMLDESTKRLEASVSRGSFRSNFLKVASIQFSLNFVHRIP